MAELENTMTYAEFVDWQAYIYWKEVKHKPKWELYLAALLRTLSNMFSKSKTLPPLDNYFIYRPERAPQALIRAKLEMFFRAHNARIEKCKET